MRDEVLNILRKLELEHQCHIIFAAESGSRAWGFASPDSDYDIRAIYVKDADYYWSLEEKPQDTFEAMLPGDMDVAAWELRKALRLFAGCNLPLYEWFGSPIIYDADVEFQQRITTLLTKYFNPIKAVHHYIAMSDHGLVDLNPDGTIAIKKLFYSLRGLFAATWADLYQTMPPTDFHSMLKLELLSDSVLQIVDALLEVKRRAREKERIIFPLDLLKFCRGKRDELKRSAEEKKFIRPSLTELNLLFRETVRQKAPSSIA